jgi:hypothetical protein
MPSLISLPHAYKSLQPCTQLSEFLGVVPSAADGSGALAAVASFEKLVGVGFEWMWGARLSLTKRNCPSSCQFRVLPILSRQYRECEQWGAAKGVLKIV